MRKIFVRVNVFNWKGRKEDKTKVWNKNVDVVGLFTFLKPGHTSFKETPLAVVLPVWVLRWFLRRVTVRKAFRQRWHMWGFSVLCVFIWRFKLEILEEVNMHKSQWKLRFPAGRRYGVYPSKPFFKCSNSIWGVRKTFWNGCTNVWIYQKPGNELGIGDLGVPPLVLNIWETTV